MVETKMRQAFSFARQPSQISTASNVIVHIKIFVQVPYCYQQPIINPKKDHNSKKYAVNCNGNSAPKPPHSEKSEISTESRSFHALTSKYL